MININPDGILNKRMNSNIEKLASESSNMKKMSKENEQELKKVCKDFESFFINYMFKEMRNTVHKSEFIPETNAQKIIDSMYYEKLSDSMSDGSGIGIADMLYSNLKREYFSK